MRPDERAKQSQIDRENEFKGNVKRGVASATSIATGAASAALASRVMPFLNEYIPTDLAMKGINKISPQLGSFLQRGREAGLNVEDGLNYIKERLNPQENEEANQTQPAKQQKNIIEQESPELHTFIDQEIRKGRKPIEAGALAQNDKRFADVIKKLMKAHKTPWSSIIESIYGNGEMAPASQPAQPNQPGQAQQGQAGAGSQKLMSILQMINQKLGK